MDFRSLNERVRDRYKNKAIFINFPVFVWDEKRQCLADDDTKDSDRKCMTTETIYFNKGEDLFSFINTRVVVIHDVAPSGRKDNEIVARLCVIKHKGT
jgi:hypothetical protein